jgi:hypothetical protein
MNFMDSMESMHEQVELKYCERCGGLFLRRPASAVVYCIDCSARFAGDPDLALVLAPTSRRRGRPARLARGPKTQRNDLYGAAQIESLQGAVGMEVRL